MQLSNAEWIESLPGGDAWVSMARLALETEASPALPARVGIRARHRRQRHRLLLAGECWLAENPGHGAAGIRFDLLLVAADGTTRRIADAFRAGDDPA